MPTNPPDFDAQAQTLAGNLFRHISARGTHGILDFSAFAAIAAALAAAYQQGREERRDAASKELKCVPPSEWSTFGADALKRLAGWRQATNG